MKRTNTRAAVIALSGVVAVTAAACGGGGSTATSSGSGTSAAAATKGGTLYYLTKRAVEHLDPQRTYIGRDTANEARMVYRTLTTFPVASGKDVHQAGGRPRHRHRSPRPTAARRGSSR